MKPHFWTLEYHIKPSLYTSHQSYTSNSSLTHASTTDTVLPASVQQQELLNTVRNTPHTTSVAGFFPATGLALHRVLPTVPAAEESSRSPAGLLRPGGRRSRIRSLDGGGCCPTQHGVDEGEALTPFLPLPGRGGTAEGARFPGPPPSPIQAALLLPEAHRPT